MTALLSLGTRQNLTISPRMQQAIRLLQLSAIDFELALRNAVMTNPFLEEAEDIEDLRADTGAIADDGETVTTRDETPVEREPEPLPTDSFAFERSAAGPSDQDGPQLGWVPEKRGLRDHLRSQLYASRRSEREVLAAEIVIETLDDDGYLRDNVETSLRSVDIHPPLGEAEIEDAIRLLRQFDPPGVCARSLVDCLQLQLDVLDGDTPGLDLARTILTEHLELLARRDFYALRRRLQCEEAAMREAIGLIRRLDPDPASRYSTKAPDYIVPDVIVTEKDGRYSASLNPSIRAGARLNRQYVDLFRECRRSQHPAMAQQLQEARWLVRNAEQRFDTILRVAQYIVEHQQAFFAVGDIALKPMVLREVANELGLHESTVSRATGNKYMATPRGCFEFKHFFSRELPMREGPACSAAAVRTLIQGLISSERRNEPLSDVDIAAELQAQGIRIARRTVTKYRRMLKVPPAEFRKVSH